jgi:hypothetical protein
MTNPEPTLPPYPYPTEGPQMNTSFGAPRSTLDNLHGDQGVVLQPPGEKLGPPIYPHSPNMAQPYGPDDPELSRVWIPDHRPPAPGQTFPASARTDTGAPGEGDGRLDVHPAELQRSAAEYTELAAHVATISPLAAEEVQRIIATHGVMGYPAAVGIAAGMAAQETALAAKATDFTTYAERLTEHAVTYAATDTDAATRYVI